MDIAVLVKVVPDLDAIRFDPERKTLIRQGVTLFVNPFDARAVRVALDLRREGEKVTVLSMGPPAAEKSLREALDLGADRALLITDRALAGSDTLVTSRVLARALAGVGHDLVLCGRNTTDSDTGQVGPQVAGLLGVPFVSSARALARDANGSALEVTADTDRGWARYRVLMPAVVSVGEKIAKIRKPTPEDVERARGRSVETLTVAQLGLDPSSVGLGGSPTVVGAIANEEPARSPRIFSEGDVAERVKAAAQAVRELLGAPAAAAPALPSLPPSLAEAREVLVHVTNEEGGLAPPALGVLSALRRLGGGVWPSATWVGRAPAPAELDRIARAGAARAYVVEVRRLPILPRVAAIAAQKILESRPRLAGMAFLSDPYGRSLAGQVAARADLGLVGDAVGIGVDASGRLLWSKPAFGGGIVASITTKTTPSLATLRPGALAPGETPQGEPPHLEVVRLEPMLPSQRVERLAAGDEVGEGWGELDGARVVLAVGMGLGAPENLEGVKRLARAWGAAVGASRRVVDAGWLPRQLQVGLTGRSLAPELVLLLGVSGATNHMVGWKRARVLLGVNPQREAPLFRSVDVGIVGRWEEVLPALEVALAPVVGAIAEAGR